MFLLSLYFSSYDKSRRLLYLLLIIKISDNIHENRFHYFALANQKLSDNFKGFVQYDVNTK